MNCGEYSFKSVDQLVSIVKIYEFVAEYVILKPRMFSTREPMDNFMKILNQAIRKLVDEDIFTGQ